MEWWILAGVVIALLGVAAFGRLRRAKAAKDTKNIYPLW
jgi:hypothetical protein